MLVKRIDLGSIPMGLYDAGEELIKGRAVVLKEGKLFHPSTVKEANAVLGFCTHRIEVKSGGDIADHDTIPMGKKAVVYTLVKNNMWGTTEFVGSPEAGDELSVAFAGTDKGKLVVGGTGAVKFDVFEVTFAGSYPMIDFIVK